MICARWTQLSKMKNRFVQILQPVERAQAIRIAQAVFLAVATISIQGCTRDTTGGTAQVGNKSQQPSATAAENAYKNRPQEFPADFPLPQYPNSQLEIAQLMSGKRSTPSVILQTPDSVKSVFRFYAKNLKEAGWDIGKVIQNKSYVMMAATRDGRESTVMITETRKGTTAISLFAGKK